MKDIWGRQNKPKLKLEINEYGQPCGKSATRFANFVGTQIRTKGFLLNLMIGGTLIYRENLLYGPRQR